MSLDTMRRLIAPLRQRVLLMIARGVLKRIDDAPKLQQAQASVLAGEIRDKLERFQNYGFTSVPLEGAEAILLFLGGNRDHGIIIAADDRRFRLKSLEPGEVALYDDQGSVVHLKRDGKIQVTASAEVKITAPAVVIEGDLTVNGDVDSTGTVTATTDVVGGGKHLKTHVHSGVTAGGSNTGAPV